MALLTQLSGLMPLPEHQFNIQGQFVSAFNNSFRRISKYSRFAVQSEEAQQLLRNEGISTTVAPSSDHPHAASRTIADYHLVNVFPHYVKQAPFTLVSHRGSKARDLCNAAQQPCTVLNPVIDPADLFRYDIDPDALPSAGRALPPIETARALVIDSAHHYTPADVEGIFANSPTLQDLICSVVIPPELLDGLKPMFPAIYTFELMPDGKSFNYYPDNHVAGQYTQDLSCLWWLRTNILQGDNCRLVVRILTSCYAHHTILVTRREMLPPKFSSFKMPPRVQIPKEIIPYLTGRFRNVDKKLYEVAAAYVCSVNVVKWHQIFARSRMTANSLKHTYMGSDLVLVTQLATAMKEYAQANVPPSLDIFAAHHLITRQGPIRWLRLLLSAPARASYEMALARLDLEMYTATQTLETLLIGSKAPTSVAFDGLLPPPTFSQQLALVLHIARGGTTLTREQRLLGGNLGQPYFSPFYAHLILGTIGLRVATESRLLRVLPALARPFLTTNVYRHLWFSPPLLLAAFVTPTLIARLYRCVHGHVTKALHNSNIPELFPGPVYTAYHTVKLAAAPKGINGWPAQVLRFTPDQDPAAETLTPDPTPARDPPTPPTDPDDDGSDDDDDGLHPCTKKGCEQHTFDAKNGFKWRTCRDGHGAHLHEDGVMCHLCPEKPQAPPPAALPSCPVRLAHPESEADPSTPECVTRTRAITVLPTKSTCPNCLAAPRAASPAMPTSQTCLFDAVASATELPVSTIWKLYAAGNPRAAALSSSPAGTSELDAHFLATRLRICLHIKTQTEIITCGVADGDEYTINYRPGHYYYTKLLGSGPPRNPNIPHQLSKVWFDFKPSQSRASALAKAIELGQEGYLVAKDKAWQLKAKSVTDFWPAHAKAKVVMIGGLPGTGKSYEVEQVLKPYVNADAENFRVVSWESDLRDAIKKDYAPKVGKGYRFCTWEAPLRGNYAPIMVLDDIGKFAPGYISLLLAMCPGITHLVLTGDPTQEVHHAQAKGCALNKLSAEVDTLTRYYSTYKTLAYRYCCSVGEHLGLPHKCDSSKKGKFSFKALPTSHLPVLTSTSSAARTMAEVGRTAHTCAGSQGITIRTDYEIHVDRYLALASDRTWFTALTRAAAGVRIVPSFSANPPPIASAIGRAVMAADQAALQTAVSSHLQRFIPPKFLDPTKFSTSKLHGGAPDYEQAVVDLPHLSGILDTTPEPSYDISQCPTPDIVPEVLVPSVWRSLYDMATHGLDQVLALMGVTYQLTRTKEERERDYEGLMTEQVDDRDDATLMFIRHKRGDTATEAWTLKERFVHPDKRTQHSQAALGSLLYTAFDKTFKPKYSAFNEALWERCRKEDQDTFLSKGTKRLAAIADRACPEWLLNRAEMFMKGQAVTKPGTIGNDAKKGQLIISFCTELNFRFGQLARYMSVVVKESLPETVFLLDGKTDQDMSAFVSKHMDFTKDSSEDDYTGFDSTQGPEFQVADAHLMRAYGIPEDEITFYLTFLTCIVTFLGLLGAMMPSGFKFTLLFNTLRSMMYQALKYVLCLLIVMLFTGDDSVINATPPESDVWKVVGHKFRLISKRFVARYPTFCGWKLTPPGCFKLPSLLSHRTAYQLARGNLPNCILNYMADVTPLNSNLEQFAPYLEVEELDAHFLTLDVLRAEAKAIGLKVFGQFTERYGASRTYNLNGGNSIKPTDDSLTLPQFQHPACPPCLTRYMTPSATWRFPRLNGTRFNMSISFAALCVPVTTLSWSLAARLTRLSSTSTSQPSPVTSFSTRAPGSPSRPQTCTSATTMPSPTTSSPAWPTPSATALLRKLRTLLPYPRGVHRDVRERCVSLRIRGSRTAPSASRSCPSSCARSLPTGITFGTANLSRIAATSSGNLPPPRPLPPQVPRPPQKRDPPAQVSHALDYPGFISPSHPDWLDDYVDPEFYLYELLRSRRRHPAPPTPPGPSLSFFLSVFRRSDVVFF